MFALVICYGCGEDSADRSASSLKDMGYEELYCNKISYISDKSEDSVPTYKVYSKLSQKVNNLNSIIARCFNDGTCEFEVKKTHRDFQVICQEFYDLGEKKLVNLYEDHVLLGFNVKYMI